MKQMKTVYSFITVNFNSMDLIFKMWCSLTENLKDLDCIELIIIDNSNEESNYRELFFNTKNCRYINSESNLGFGRACNLGSKYAIGDILVFVNPDIIFIDNIVMALCQYHNLINDGTVIGFNFYDANKKPGISYGEQPSLKIEIMELFLVHKLFPLFYSNNSTAKRYQYNAGYTPLLIDAGYVSGALFSIKKEVFQKNNGFDSSFFLYFEETELMERLRVNGYSIKLYTKPLAQHIESSITQNDSDFKIYNIEKGRNNYYEIIYKTQYCKLMLFKLIRICRLIFMGVSKKRIVYIKCIKILCGGDK